MIPLFSTNQVREVDDYAINQLGIPGLVLMENTSIQIFSYVLERTQHLKKRKRIGIVCGKGNNGGDGFAAARQFSNHGFSVCVIHIGIEEEMSPDCLSNFRYLSGLSKSNQEIFIKKYDSEKDLRYLADCDIILDAILGSGAHGRLKEPYNSIVSDLNKMKAYKVAVDIPTGLDADTGYAESVFNADLTVTLGELKKGLFFGDGYTSSGDIEKGNIGINDSFFDRFEAEEYLIEPEDVFNILPKKKKNEHKYSAGKVLTIAGSGSLPGAALMTAKSAFRVGAGASVLSIPRSVRKLIFKNISEVIVKAYDDDGKEFLSELNFSEIDERLDWADAIAIGPGLGREEQTQQAVNEILKRKSNKKFVIDADAVFALNAGRFRNLNLKNSILTPHYAEFSNLIGIETSELKKDTLLYGKEFVKETGAYLVLKGAPTIIFTPSGEALINSTGNPGMAKFGTGDVLTGTVAGFLSQLKDLEKAAITGVYIHSLAADLLIKDYTEFGFTATDIIKKLPAAIKFLISTFND